MGSEKARAKHEFLCYGAMKCLDCGKQFLGIEALALHRRTSCEERYHICRFCGTELRRGPPATLYADRIMGLSEHESFCGSQTKPCSKCGSRVPLKMMEAH